LRLHDARHFGAKLKTGSQKKSWEPKTFLGAKKKLGAKKNPGSRKKLWEKKTII
jgi:hypothetical protein